MGTVGYMSPEQAAGRARRLPVRPVFLRGDSLRDGDRPTRLPARHGRRNADRDHSGRAAVRLSAPTPEPRAAALDHRTMPQQGAGGALRLDEGPRARSRRLFAIIFRRRRCPARCAAAAPEQPNVAAFQRLSLSARDDPLGALRPGRTHGHLRRLLGRKSDAPLLDPAGEPRVERADAAGRRNPVDFRQRDDGDLARASLGRPFHLERNARAGVDARRRAAGDPRGRPVGRLGARRRVARDRPKRRRQEPDRVPDRKRPLRNGGMGESPARVARRLARRVPDPSRSRERHGLGLRRRSERPRSHAHERLGDGVRPGLAPPRQGDLVHGHARRRRARDLGRLAFRRGRGCSCARRAS